MEKDLVEYLNLSVNVPGISDADSLNLPTYETLLTPQRFQFFPELPDMIPCAFRVRGDRDDTYLLPFFGIAIYEWYQRETRRPSIDQLFVAGRLIYA